MNEKNKKKLEAKKFRTVWKFSPITRVVKNRKKYDRNKKRKRGEYGQV